ncbi:thyrotropin releasing hormone [Ctenodactylus gundi]
MREPLVLLALAVTLTLSGVPGGCAQPEAAEQEAAMAAEHPGLEELLQQAGRLLLLQDNLQRRLLGALGDHTGSQVPQPDRLSRRQHPGKREEEREEGDEEEEEGGAAGPHKRQHPGRRSLWPGRKVTRRQHPGRRLDAEADSRGWEEEEEQAGGEGAPTPLELQRPGRRALGGLCGPPGACGQAGLLLGLLEGLSGGQSGRQEPRHPGRSRVGAWEPPKE